MPVRVLKFKMASVVLSKDEKVFIMNGVFDDFRVDGRARRDYRYFEIETGIVSNTNGSARLRLVRIKCTLEFYTEIVQNFFLQNNAYIIYAQAAQHT